MFTLVRKGIHFCYRQCILPHSLNEDDHRHEYILNIILSGFLGLVCLFGISLITTYLRLGPSHHQIPISLYVGIIGLFTGLLFLSRKGYFKIATYLFIGLYFIIATSLALLFGMELPMVLVSYVIIIIISSILVSTRFSIITTSLIGFTLIIMGYLQVVGITTPDTSWKQIPILFSDAVQLCIALFLITLITWLSNKEIDASLKRARTSEQTLIVERNNLEITVHERTREIKLLQEEKITQLYRSAEFGRLSSGLFHDLMNPLNALIGSIDTLKLHPQDTASVDRYLEKSVSASRRMGTYLESIRKQLGRNTVAEYFSCKDEITEAVEILTYQARHTGITLSIIKLDDIQLFGNPLKFHQIALNLIANAIDSYKNTSPENPVVIISLIQKDSSLIFSVQDHGSGIPHYLLDTIFDPFFTTKEPDHGTGLGLSTTKNIVHRDFAGTIEVVSHQGLGSTFTVTIPIT